MLIMCTAMNDYRSSCDLGKYITMYRNLQPQISAAKIYSLFLNDALCKNLKERILSLYHMKIGWCTKMGIEY
jgi:hypothetical protein